jgi:hypothetical protein
MRIRLKDAREVVHFWANQVQAEGRGSNISFQGTKLYSYFTCIADILPTGTVVWSYRTYSMTTTCKHQGPARYAANHRASVWCYDPTASAATNMQHERQEVAQLLLKAEKAYATKKDGTQSVASKNKQDKLRGEVLRVANRANAYLAAMQAAGLGLDVHALDINNMGLLLDELKAAEAARETARQADRARRAQENARQEAEAVEVLAEWRQGGNRTAGLHALPVALRLVRRMKVHKEAQVGPSVPPIAPEDCIIVETSHGAEIPVEDAKRLWPLLLRVRNGNGPWVCDPRSKERKLGPYTLNEISADGSIRVGCHQIDFSEIEKIAEQLGLLEAA